MSPTLAAPVDLEMPDSLEQLDEVELEELDELGERVGRLRQHERELADEQRAVSEEVAPIQEWVLHAAREGQFADELFLGQLAILWLELSDAVEHGDQDAFEMAVTMIDEAIRRARRRRVREGFDESPQKSIAFVLKTLKGASSRDLAPLFGVSERTIRAWQRALPDRPQVDPERLNTVAQVLYDIAPSTTSHGALRWFQRPFHQLHGRTPIEVLQDESPQSFQALRVLARSGRGQGG